MIQDPLLVLAFMLGVVAFTRWLEERFDWVKKISSAVVCTLLGIVLANMGVIAHTGPMHDANYLLCADGQFGDESWLPNTNETTEGFIYGSGRTVFH